MSRQSRKVVRVEQGYSPASDSQETPPSPKVQPSQGVRVVAVAGRTHRQAKSVTIAALRRNPAVEGRTGKLQSPSLILMIDDEVDVELFTLLGAGQELRVTPMRVLQLIREHQLKALRIGRDWFVLKQDLQAFKKVRSRFGGRLPMVEFPQGEADLES